MFCVAQNTKYSTMLNRIKHKLTLLLYGMFFALVSTLACNSSCFAQTYIEADVGYPPTTGTFVF